MAKNSVTLDIGTNYRGEGFKKLDAALKQSTSNTKRASLQWAQMHRDAAKMASTAWTEFYSKIRIITGAVKSAWNGLKLVMSKSFNFETQTMQFKTLIGDIDEAKEHMLDLKELGDTPPFSLDEFARASRALMVMSDGALGFKESMKMIGDTAAATGNGLEDVGHYIGRLYAYIRDGEPISRAANQLRNMGILTPEVVQELKALQEAGASNVEIWEKVEKALSKYNGAMEDTEKTGNGLIGAISSRWDNIVRNFGDAFMDTAEGGLREVLHTMEDLEDSDAIDRWADNANEAINRVAESAGMLKSVFSTLWDWIDTGIKATVGTATAWAAGMDNAGHNGEGWFNWSAGANAAKQYWNDEVMGNNADEQRMERQRQEMRAQDRAERKAAREQREKDRAERERERKNRILREGKGGEGSKAAGATTKEETKASNWGRTANQIAADEFVAGYERDKQKEKEKELNDKINAERERGVEEQKKLDDELAKAQNAVREWIDSFNGNKHTNFTQFNKGQNQAAKDNAVAITDANGDAVIGPDGQPLTMDKKQANQVKSNRQQLDRLLKMKNPDARTRKEIERRQAFDDMFNGEKIKERMKAEEDARKAKEEADKKMRANIDALKKLFVNENGAAI